jgi:NADPH-dependent curcumin reductase CurA
MPTDMDIAALSAAKLPATYRKIVLASRPTGAATVGHLRIEECEMGGPALGEVAIRNLYMSLDPAMRPRMTDAPSYAPPYQVGEALTGQAIGVVVESASPSVSVGQIVLHNFGWREYAIVDASATTVIEPNGLPLSAYLGPLGSGGFTAWIGLTRITQLRPGETIWISAAAGSVGQMAGQIAKYQGASVIIGSTGSAAKAASLTEFGYDVGFDYHTGLDSNIGRAAPDGIDVYFDNVGGEHLEAAIAHARVHARFAICGAVSGYDRLAPPTAPRNLVQIVAKRLSLIGFLIFDYTAERAAFLREMEPLVASGEMRYRETIALGLDAAPQGFIDMINGDKTGKALVQLVD